MIPLPLVVGVVVAVGLWWLVSDTSIPLEEVELEYGPNASPRLPSWQELVLRETAAEAGVRTVYVTSTNRSVANQARVMVDLVVEQAAARGGFEAARTYGHNLYGSAGEQVIDVIVDTLAAGGSEDAAEAAAVAKATSLVARGQVISKHQQNSQVQAIDLAPSKMDGREAAYAAALDRRAEVHKVIEPNGDPALHVEIKLSAAPVGLSGWLDRTPTARWAPTRQAARGLGSTTPSRSSSRGIECCCR